jgi:hypothetical protein
VLENPVAGMTPGEVLLDVPMSQIIERMGRAIADAQLRLDELSIRTAVLLGESRLDFRNTAGALVSRSLLELGFTPSFYHFTDTTITIHVTLTMKVEEQLTVGASFSFGSSSVSGTGATGGTAPSPGTLPVAAGPSGPAGTTPRPGTTTTTSTPASAIGAAQALVRPGTFSQDATMFGLTINAEYTRRYEFDTTASSTVSTKMVSVPPPAVFMDALREHYRIAGL